MALIPVFEEVFQNPIFSIMAITGVFGIGIFQGIVLGKAILLRFPRLQNHAKIVSISLFFLFLVNTILSISRFAHPEKIDLVNVFQDHSSVASVFFLIFGMNAGLLAVFAVSVAIMIMVLLKFTHVHGIAKILILSCSLFVLLLTGISRLTDLTPSTLEVFLYFLYQFGLTIGILIGSVRKIKSRKIDWK